MPDVVQLIFLLLVLAVIVWGGEALLALLPGYDKLKKAARIIAIVAIALYLLGLVAGMLGVSLPWQAGVVHRHR